MKCIDSFFSLLPGSRMCAAGRWAICFLLCCLTVMPAVAHDEKAEAEALIARFDASDGAVEVANRFFAFLDEREFTETRIVLAKGTPADSVRQKVWYWAAEWYNDVQNYQQAQTYARKALPLFHQTNAEQATAQELLSIDYKVGARRGFWARPNNGAEVDFVLPHNSRLYPIEVKSGINARLRSLQVFMDSADTDIAVRVWARPYSKDHVATTNGKEFTLINLPFYLIGRIKKLLP